MTAECDYAALAGETANLTDRLLTDADDIAARAGLTACAARLGLATEPFVGPLPPADDPRVTVIVLACNELAHTRRCLAALRRTLPPGLAEIILVDNGSTDGTAAWAATQPDLRLLHNAENRGFGPANNQAAELARGEHLLLLNNDTEPQPGWLERLVTTIDADPGLGAVGARLVSPDGLLLEAGAIINLDGTCTNRGREAPDGIHSYAAPVTVPYVSACGLLVRRAAFAQVGGFDPRYAPAYYEDVDLCVALRAAGWRVAVEPAACVVHAESVTARRLSGSEPRRLKLQEAARRRFLEKWEGRLPADDPADPLTAVRAPLLPAPIRVAILTPRYSADCLWGESMISSDLREALEWRADVREVRVFSYADADAIAGFNPDLVFSFTAWRRPLRFGRAVTIFYVVNFTHELMPPGQFLTWDDALRMEADVYAANTQEGVARLGRAATTSLLHMAANPRVHRPCPSDPRYRSRVTYLGSYNPATKGHAVFDRYVLPAADFDLALWGEMWENAPASLRRHWRGLLPGGEIARLYSSVEVALGFNAASQAAAGMVNNRVFEVLACGALLLSDRVPAIEAMFGDCAIFTDGGDDTRDKLAHYLAHPEERARLTALARRRILAEHTYDHRARQLVEMYAAGARAKGRL